MLRLRPEVIAYDLHPDYLSTRYALSSMIGIKIQIQHHHAHHASCMAENAINGEEDIKKWTNYPNFVLLRLKGASLELMNEIAQHALTNLNGIPYDCTVGIFSSKFKKAGEITRTHCSHLIWEAFRLFDYDLDSDGGMIVTPKDIVKSPHLQIVQVFGVNPDDIWP